MPGQNFIARLRGAFLCTILAATAFAEQPRQFKLSHPLSAERELSFTSARFTGTEPDTLRVLAVMVEFQPDNDPLTTGTGLFDTSTTAGQIIDPPPHDSAYFGSHLTFLDNYWKKVTNGTLIVISDLVDTVIRLPRSMRSYSPPPGTTGDRELAEFVHDAWRRTDSARPSLDFSRYQAFSVFHAGIGRDIDVASLIGFDPTPYDIPSLYLSLSALQRGFGSDYRGVPVRDSSFHITNSMILPETENRFIPSIGGQVLLQLGINGLVAASLGSHLGLPDLFDTRTGRSGIGRFGLMDGESIFSWGGVFPPEPSGWEKYYLEKKYGLGMLDIVEAQSGQSVHDLDAVSKSTAGRDTVVRVSISPKEYFLIENRNRDARRDSTIVWRVFNNAVIRRAFARDTAGFDAFDQSSLYGVVIDVDEFDFSLPGGVASTGEFFDGGILVWHIDESVIEANYAANSVNANPQRRGVDLEEADGSQDIGEAYGFLDPGSGSEAGTVLDFWYAGNGSPVYRNEFSPESHPNSLSNRGANSHIAIKDFGPRSPKMQFTIERGDSLAKPLPGYPLFIGRSRIDNSPQFLRALFVSIGDSIYAFRVDTAATATPYPSGLFSDRGGRFPVSFIPSLSETTVVAGIQDSVLFIFRAVDGNNDRVFESIAVDSVKFNAKLTTTPVVRENAAGAFEVLVGDQAGRIVEYPGLVVLDSAFAGNPVSSIAMFTSAPLQANRWVAVAGNVLRNESGASATLPFTSPNWQVAAVGNKIVAVDVGGNSMLLLESDLRLTHRISLSGTGLTPPAIADIDGDGRQDVIAGNGSKLFVINQAGANVDFFPLTLSAPVTGAPIIARLSANRSLAHIVVTTSNGLVEIYDSKGRRYPGFPLGVSGINAATPAIFALPTGSLSADTPGLIVSDTLGYLSAWQLQSVPFEIILPWSSYRGNGLHNGADTTSVVPIPLSTDFFPSSRAYNWPNPVYDGKTYIRYFVQENATVRIRIFDLAGELVDELFGSGIGGMDNEMEWNVGGIQSGVYFGRIEAESVRQRGVAIIKIAVVK